MGGGGNSGQRALYRSGSGKSGSKGVKRPSTSGVKYARELHSKNDYQSMRTLKSELLKDVNSFEQTGKVPEHTSLYRIMYKNGNEITIRYKDGKEIIVNQDKKRVTNFSMTGIAYIAKANGNQEFKDSLGFNSKRDRDKKIFSNDKRFGSYTNEVNNIFRPKKKKSTSKTTTKKKSASKTTTTKKSTTPKSAPKNTAAKPKIWEKGKKRIIKRK